MCSVCMRTPCDPRCPTHRTPRRSTPASIVESPSFRETRFYEIGCDYHEDCFTDCAANILVSQFGATKRAWRRWTDGRIPKFRS